MGHLLHRRGLMAATFVWVATATLVGTVAIGAAAAHGGHHGRHTSHASRVVAAAAGVVQASPAAGATSFQIKERGGAIETIDLSGAPTYVEHGVSSPTLANVQQGDLVAVFGTTSGNTVTASQIVIAVPSTTGSQKPAAAGIVQGNPTGDQFTIETRGATPYTVQVSSGTGGTTYYERGVSDPSLSNVTAGELVCVFGTVSGSTITATTVVIHNDFRHGNAAGGTVQATPGTGATSFTIQTRDDVVVTVDVTANTHYFERGSGQVTLSAVLQGDLVGVFGTPSGTNTITALAVLIAAPPPTSGNYATAGTVQTSPVGGDFVIETCSHTQLTVDTNGSTQFIVWGQTGSSIDDIKPGIDVAVFGTLSGGTLTATQIVIGGNERAHPGYFSGGGRGHEGPGRRDQGGGGNDWGGSGDRHGHRFGEGGPAPDSSTGSTGSSGSTGSTGGTGASGETGATGASGSSSATGATGATG